MRGETRVLLLSVFWMAISIHSPHARGDRALVWGGLSFGINFNPLPSCEGRRGGGQAGNARADFNPLPSCEGRRYAFQVTDNELAFQSTPLMRGETVRWYGVVYRLE